MFKLIRRNRKKVGVVLRLELLTLEGIVDLLWSPIDKLLNLVKYYLIKIEKAVLTVWFSFIAFLGRRISNFKLRMRAIGAIFKVLFGNPQNILLDNKKSNLLLIYNERKAKEKAKPIINTKKIAGFIGLGLRKTFSLFGHLMESVGGKLVNFSKKDPGKIVNVLLVLVVFSGLVLGGFWAANLFADTEEAICEYDSDLVIVLDITSGMNGGDSDSKCEWENLEFVDNEFGGTYMCVSYSEVGLTESECIANDDGASQCDDVIFTESVDDKLTRAIGSVNTFLDNLKTGDQSALVTYGLQANLDKELSGDHEATKTALSVLNAGGSSSFEAALNLAIAELSSERANPQAIKTIIVVSDDPISESLLAEAEENNIKVIIIDANDLDISDDLNNALTEICSYGSISGCKFNDSNNDGDIAEEEKISGWEINLAGEAEMSQLTDENGCYLFAGLDPGDYTVSEAEDEEYIQTYPENLIHELTLSSGEHKTDIDFANYFPLCGNSILDEGEQCDDGNTEDGDGCYAICELEPILGCIDQQATNYDENADTDDGSCIYPVLGCTNPLAENYDENTDTDDGSCTFAPNMGCTDSEALNYDEEAEEDNGTCEYEIFGCTDPEALNYNEEANTEDNSCEYEILGCTDESATNYDETANSDDGSCTFPSAGGGGAAIKYVIKNESNATPDTESVIVTWLTDFFATSRVIYDTVSHKILGEGENKGYTYSTEEDSHKVTYHEVEIADLIPGTVYYWRAVSHGSPEAISAEMTFETKESEEVIETTKEQQTTESQEELNEAEVAEAIAAISDQIQELEIQVAGLTEEETVPFGTGGPTPEDSVFYAQNSAEDSSPEEPKPIELAENETEEDSEVSKNRASLTDSMRQLFGNKNFYYLLVVLVLFAIVLKKKKKPAKT